MYVSHVRNGGTYLHSVRECLFIATAQNVKRQQLCRRTEHRWKPPPIINVPLLGLRWTLWDHLYKPTGVIIRALEVMDYTTKWLEAIDFKSVKSKTVTRALVDQFSKIEITKEILTNQLQINDQVTYTD